MVVKKKVEEYFSKFLIVIQSQISVMILILIYWQINFIYIILNMSLMQYGIDLNKN